MTPMPEEEMLRTFAEIARFEVPEAAVERDLERVRQVLTREQHRQSTWRALRRSRWAKLCSAAALLIIAWAGWQMLASRELRATELLAEVACNTEKLTWTKTITESFVPGREEPVSVDVHWTDVRNKRVFAIYNRTYIHLMDYTLWRWSIYRPDTNDMIVQPLKGEWVSPSAAVQDYTRKLRTEGIEVAQSQQQDEGRDVIVLQFAESLNHLGGTGPVTNTMMNGKYVKTLRHKLIIDKRDRLLGTAETTYLDADGNVIVLRKSRSEPVRTGPADIHELGVPKDVKVINKMPDERVQQIRESSAAHRSRFLDTYMAVITEARLEDGRERIIEGMVVLQRVKALRVDVYRRLYGQRDKVTALYRKELSASMTHLKPYWPQEENWGIRSVRLYDGLWQYVLEVQDEKLVAWDKQRRPDGDLYADDDVEDFAWRTLGWLNEPEHLFEDDYSRAHGLIAMELTSPGQGSRLPKRLVMYVDPQRDYLCHRYINEELFDAPWQDDKNGIDKVKDPGNLTETVTIRDVLEYGRTSAGRWYPKVISETGYHRRYRGRRTDEHRVIRIHLIAEQPQFPPGTFSPENLPQAMD